MRPSRVMTGTPKYRAVAATMRSGMSGTSARATCHMASTTSALNVASSKFDKINHFGEADGRQSDFAAFGGSPLKKRLRGR